MRSTIALALALSLAVVACKQRSSTDETPIAPDPAPHDPKKPAPTPPPGDGSLVLLHAKAIDPVSATVLHTLEPTPPLPKLEDSRGDRGYMQRLDALEAFDLRAGKKLWSQRASCNVLAAIDGGAICATTHVLDVYDDATGAHTTLPSSASADVMQILAFERHVLVLRGDGTLESFDVPPAAPKTTTKLPFPPVGFQPLVANERGACIASAASSDVTLACYDGAATLLRSTTYTLSKPTDPKPTWFLTRQLDARFFVVATRLSSGVQRGVVVRVADGVEVARIEQQVVAAVARPDGALEAVLVTHPETRLLEASGATRWTSKVHLDDSASALLLDHTLVVASFEPIAAGSTLHALDLATGATLWTGDVALLPIAHSIYSNDVTLTLRGGRVAMRGREAGQDYLELFEPRDGKRVLSELAGLW